MTEVCVTWKQPDGDHFNGFCTNRFRQVTPPAGVIVASGCQLCVDPVQVPGICPTCDVPPAPVYKVTIASPVSNPSIDSSAYAREFIVYQAAGCVWQSEELELGVWRNPYTFLYEVVDPATPYPGSTTVASGFAPRVVLTCGRTTGGVLKTTWSVELRWRNLFFFGATTAFIVRYVLLFGGEASEIDCHEPVTGDVVSISRNTNGGDISGSEVGQFDPWLSGYNPNNLPPYTFTVRPFSS